MQGLVPSAPESSVTTNTPQSVLMEIYYTRFLFVSWINVPNVFSVYFAVLSFRSFSVVFPVYLPPSLQPPLFLNLPRCRKFVFVYWFEHSLFRRKHKHTVLHTKLGTVHTPPSNSCCNELPTILGIKPKFCLSHITAITHSFYFDLNEA